MFGVGLHFSIGDLLAVRTIALPGAIVQITTVLATESASPKTRPAPAPQPKPQARPAPMAVATVICTIAPGRAMVRTASRSPMRALEGQGLLDSDKGRIAVGWLIVEDLAMVVALVLLPALAPSLGGEAMQGAGHHGPPEHGLWGRIARTRRRQYRQRSPARPG
jgi:CPA2 family monovalent cation:H+ antiporter-2